MRHPSIAAAAALLLVSASASAKPPGEATRIPALGVAIGCSGKVTMVGKQALVACRPMISVMPLDRARRLDDGIAEVRASLGGLAPTSERRTPRSWRLEHENRASGKVNHWVDVVIVLDGRILLCQAQGASADEARRAGDLCEALSPAR